MGRSKHRHLLQDPEVRRWYNNVARGSVVTAEERLRRLGRFCALLGHMHRSFIASKQGYPIASLSYSSLRRVLGTPPSTGRLLETKA
ncbi:MAG: hypothetical protein QXO94_06200 [Candidatus Bathyarchaeia archaeon]